METAARWPSAEARIDPEAGHSRWGSSARLAVGNPSVPPRWSPATTTPSSSNGRPSIAAAVATSPSASADADGSGRDARPPRARRRSRSPGAEQLEVAGAPDAEAEVGSPATTTSTPDPAQVDLGELLRREPLELGNERRHERRLDAGVVEQLEPALERRQQLDAVAQRDPRVRVERDHGRCEACCGDRVDERLGGPGARRRSCRSPRRAGLPLELAMGACATFSALPEPAAVASSRGKRWRPGRPRRVRRGRSRCAGATAVSAERVRDRADVGPRGDV